MVDFHREAIRSNGGLSSPHSRKLFRRILDRILRSFSHPGFWFHLFKILPQHLQCFTGHSEAILHFLHFAEIRRYSLRSSESFSSGTGSTASADGEARLSRP